MPVSDDVGFEITEHYLASLAQTANGRGNHLIPYRADESLLFVLHKAEITEPLYGRENDDDPPPYDKPYYTLCFAFVTDDQDLWRKTADGIVEAIPFLTIDRAQQST